MKNLLHHSGITKKKQIAVIYKNLWTLKTDTCKKNDLEVSPDHCSILVKLHKLMIYKTIHERFKHIYEHPVNPEKLFSKKCSSESFVF